MKSECFVLSTKFVIGLPLFILLSAHLVDELKEVILGGVHAHGPHGPPQLLRADVPPSVHVKLIKRLKTRTLLHGRILRMAGKRGSEGRYRCSHVGTLIEKRQGGCSHIGC